MKSRKALSMTFAVILALAAGIYFFSAHNNRSEAESTHTAEMPATETAQESSSYSVESVLADRGLGNPSAPIRIDEFASLTCPHCAHFNKDTFEQLKTQYIDTGKVYFVYNDFPLDAAALDAAIVARCLPQDRYFQFIKFLFDTQKDWANENYRDYLKQNAKLLGLEDKTFEACLGDASLKQKLVAKMQEAGAKHNIKSTPSFIINGKDVVSGAVALENFQKYLDAPANAIPEKAAE